MLAKPQFTFHLKESLQADLPARAIPVRDVRPSVAACWAASSPVRTRRKSCESRVAGSPLVEVVFE